MRKYFNLFIAVVTLGWLAACNEDYDPNSFNNTGNSDYQLVSLSAVLPENAPGVKIGTEDQLRCKIYVYDVEKEGEEAELYTDEMLVQDDGTILFEFPVHKDAEYECMLWADYVSPSAPTTDKYYDSSNLNAITVKTDNAELLVNNEAAEAFYATIAKSDVVENKVQVTLASPFATLSVRQGSEADDEEVLNSATTMDISYQMPTNFNMITGKCEEVEGEEGTGVAYQNIQISKVTPKGEGVYFTAYFFVSDMSQPETITQDNPIRIETYNDKGKKAYSIVLSNLQLSTTSGAEGVISYNNQDVTIEIGLEDLVIGQFLYADGTWGDEYTEDAIGLIFADKTKAVTDNVEEYGKEGQIMGYAMALENANPEGRYLFYDFGNNLPIGLQTGVTDAGKQEDTYAGYAYTQTWLANPTVQEENGDGLVRYFKDYLEANPVTASNLSSWYIPSGRQLIDLLGAALPGGEGEGAPVNDTYAANFQNYSEPFSTAATRWMYSSTIRITKSNEFENWCVRLDNTGTTIGRIRFQSNKYTTRGNIRPVITIFQP